MDFPGKPAQRSATTLAFACLIASVSGCASPGPARPPSLHLPRPVADLTAARTGSDVILHWTTPDKTTDGLKTEPPLSAEICRESAVPHNTCTPVKRMSVRPGPTEASDALPSALTVNPATLLTYRVRVFNGNGHSAGLSAPAFAAAGAAPPPIQNLHVTPVREGAMLEWQPQATETPVELDRTLVQTTVIQKPSTKRSFKVTPSAPAEIYLRASKLSSNSGGTIDPTAHRGETYRYTAQRVDAVTLDGHTLELRSIPSPAITTVMRDTFPPHTPTGLGAVPGVSSIDLSWEPDTEPDLAGYLVYRQPVAADGTLTGTSTRLTTTPISAPAFSDRTAVPGQTYSYRITAIDTAGNASPASAAARESLRKQ